MTEDPVKVELRLMKLMMMRSHTALLVVMITVSATMFWPPGTCLRSAVNSARYDSFFIWHADQGSETL